jgi:N-acyl homoserine lactone hydrolase
MGQPIAGSNPALSASLPTGLRNRMPNIAPLEMAEFRFADDEPLAGQTGVVMAYAVRHDDGILLFDTGFGFGSDEVEARYHPRARRLPDVLAEAGIAVADVTAVVNSHLHIDHAGQNDLFPNVPIHVQPDEWRTAHTTEYTILEWVDFPGARYEVVAGDHDLLPGIRVIATPGHTAGHQSVVVDTPEGRSILAGQAVYSHGEWTRAPSAWEGRSRAWDRDAYDRSVQRLRDLEPARIYFGHDRRSGPA